MVQKGWLMVRYADDFVILCSGKQEAEEAPEEVRIWMEKAGLTLHPTKTCIVNAAEAGGFDFLGFKEEEWRTNKSGVAVNSVDSPGENSCIVLK